MYNKEKHKQYNCDIYFVNISILSIHNETKAEKKLYKKAIRVYKCKKTEELIPSS